MIKLLHATPLFASSAVLGILGVTLLLVATRSIECGCYVLGRD